LDAEFAGRQAADAALQEGIDSEASARTAGDAALQTDVNGKAPTSHASAATTYGAASTDVYGHMRFATDDEAAAGIATNRAVTPKQSATAISAEALLRAEADAALQDDIGAEASARTSADTGLAENIASEASTRGDEDEALRGSIAKLRADFDAFMAEIGIRTWQNIADAYPTWEDVLDATGTWMRVYLAHV
jgi:hypothetical protein